MRLPQVPNRIPRQQTSVVSLRGINFSDDFDEGDLAECSNMSAIRWPYMATRNGRGKTEYAGVTALTAWNKLIAVQGTSLLYDGKEVGTVTAGEKQFAVVNTKLVIWPDKVYLDMEDGENMTVKPLGVTVSSDHVYFQSHNVVTADFNFSTYFKVGDTVEISGIKTSGYKENNKTVTVTSLKNGWLWTTDNAFSVGSDTRIDGVTFSRAVPDMDYICESENRLFGCSNEKKTIYASALGDPTNFNTYQGLSTDSYALGVGSEGDFTGCCKLGSSVLFWKEHMVHKLLGSYPAEYSLYSYAMEGLQRGCNKSMQVMNETLIYQGVHGVYAYSGGMPTLISKEFGRRMFSNGVAGADGVRYYLSTIEGITPHLFVYDTQQRLWMEESSQRVVDFARVGKDLYALCTDGTVWEMDSGEIDPNMDWSVTFVPFYGKVRSGSSVTHHMTRKNMTKLTIRMELPRKSWVDAYTSYDGGTWQLSGRIAGQKDDTVTMMIAANRCDKFQLKLVGRGPCTVLGMQQQFRVGSDM